MKHHVASKVARYIAAPKPIDFTRERARRGRCPWTMTIDLAADRFRLTVEAGATPVDGEAMAGRGALGEGASAVRAGAPRGPEAGEGSEGNMSCERELDTARERVLALEEDRARLADTLAHLQDKVRVLVARVASPCFQCGDPSTRTQPVANGRWACDAHASGDMGSVYYAEELRSVVRALGESP